MSGLNAYKDKKKDHLTYSVSKTTTKSTQAVHWFLHWFLSGNVNADIGQST